MIIEPARIPPEGKRLAGEDAPSILDIEENEDLRIRGPVGYDLFANVVAGELIVKGKVAVDVQFRCSRCLDQFPLTVLDPGFEFVRELDDMNESVDLTPDMREAILVSFPAYPVCRPDCKGVCPRCGANLNRERCDCKPLELPHRSVLDGMSL